MTTSESVAEPGPVTGTLGRIARIGLAADPDPLFSDLIEAVAAAAGEIGVDAHPVHDIDEAELDERLLVIGRPGRHERLVRAPGGPPRILWVGEPLPAVSVAGSALTGAPRQVGRAARVARPLGRVLRRAPLPGPLDRRRVGVATERLLAANLRELTDAVAAGASLVVTSRDRAATVAALGIDVTAVPFGYHERHAGPLTPVLGHERDVPLLLLGTRGTHTRRAREVSDLARTSAMTDLRVVDGVWGDERAALLRRTRVIVDVHRIPGNFVGLRLLLAIAAGAVVVTEPMTDPFPFVPGVHHLEAALADLAAVASEVAADEARRAAIIEAGQASFADALAMRASVRRVLDAGRAT